MAARFTVGQSIAQTNKSTQEGQVKEPKTASMKLQQGNTMSGMPGRINTPAHGDRGNAVKGGKAMTAKTGGPGSRAGIGQKGGTSKRLNSPGKKAAGTMGNVQPKKGNGGKIESLKGRTMTSAEGRKSSSQMY